MVYVKLVFLICGWSVRDGLCFALLKQINVVVRNQYVCDVFCKGVEIKVHIYFVSCIINLELLMLKHVVESIYVRHNYAI